MPRTLVGTFNFLTVLYYSIVSNVRQSDGNALRGLLKEIMQNIIMIAVFYMFIEILGMRSMAVRGNFVLFLISGIFLFMTHTKAVKNVSSSGNAVHPMLQHTPVSTLLLIVASALATLYIQIIGMGVILLIAHVLIEPISFYSFKGFMYCFFIAWASGIAIGLVLLALYPFFPTAIPLISMLYRRANMIFSGKMMLANTLPASILPFFIWNPLFHSIDQARGYTFINYTPRVTSIEYPLILTFVFVVLGMMLEHWARKYVSQSWSSRQ